MAKQSEATLLLKIKTMGQEALDSLSESFDTIKTTALIAFGAISAVVVKSIGDYREQEEATNALTQAMVNNGVYSKALKDDYLAQASAIQKLTLFGDEQVIAAQAVIQQQIGEQKVTKELTLAVADLAQAKKMDLASAADLVAKTLGSSTNMLSRYGVQIDNNLRGSERLAAVTEALNQKFGGQAQAATTGLGSLKQLANAVSDLAETFGEKLAPFVTQAAIMLKGFAEDSSKVTPIMDAFIGSLQFLGMIGLEVFGTIKALGMAIGVGLSTAVMSAQQALEGNFKQALETVKTGFKTIQDEAIKIEQETEAQITSLFTASEAARAESLKRDEENLRQSLENKKNMKIVATEEEMAKQLADNQMKYEMEQADHALVLAQKTGNDAQILAAKIAHQDAILKSDASHKAKLKAQETKHKLQMEQMDKVAAASKMAALKDTFSTIATLSQSSNSQLAAIGKAAALTQIAIDTPTAISKALASAPPPFNFALAAGVGAAMAQQAQRVMGIPLAEGGIVKARPGGIQATIGEGGRDEAVIPLENGQIPGSQGNVTIHFNGPVMGDERQAYDFAVMVDRKLLEVRRNGDSVAFERIT